MSTVLQTKGKQTQNKVVENKDEVDFRDIVSDNIVQATEGKQSQKTFVEKQDKKNSDFENSRRHAEKSLPVTQKFINERQLKTVPNTKESIVQKWIFTVKRAPAIDPKDLPKNLQFVVDTNSNVVFLVDTGSEISILLKQLTNGVNRNFPPQSSTIQEIGKGVVHLFWILQEPGNHGIIGLDILMNHRLTISPATAELCEIGSKRVAKLSYPKKLATKMVVSVNKMVVTVQKYSSLEEKCRKLVEGFPEITREPDYNTSPKHNHTLDIVVDNYNPKFIRPRRCWGKRIKIEEHFNDLLQKRVVKRCSGDTCVSPVTCVKKKNGDLRACVDYTRLKSFMLPTSKDR